MTENEYWALLDELRAESGDLDLTDANVHAAAVGLTAQNYRNTEAVEDSAHADGPWTDEDMLRNNARATEFARVALVAIRDGADPVDALGEMQHAWVEMLPNDRARNLLIEATGNAPDYYAEFIERLGLAFLLTHLTQVWAYPRQWWGSSEWTGYVDRYCALTPLPPDPTAFRERMLKAPWDLTDEQAAFVTDHRYDVSPPRDDLRQIETPTAT